MKLPPAQRESVKAPDFMVCEQFVIQGRPSNRSHRVFRNPGFAGTLSDNKPQAGRPQVADKDEKTAQAQRTREEGKGYREIASALGVSIGTVSGWLSKRSKSVQ
jgi:hypothetical protein